MKDPLRKKLFGLGQITLGIIILMSLNVLVAIVLGRMAWVMNQIPVLNTMIRDGPLFATTEEFFKFWTGGVVGGFIMLFFMALQGYDVFKESERFTLEELVEIAEWCEGGEPADTPWVPSEIPLYNKIVKMLIGMGHDGDGRYFVEEKE